MGGKGSPSGEIHLGGDKYIFVSSSMFVCLLLLNLIDKLTTPLAFSTAAMVSRLYFRKVHPVLMNFIESRINPAHHFSNVLPLLKVNLLPSELEKYFENLHEATGSYDCPAAQHPTPTKSAIPPVDERILKFPDCNGGLPGYQIGRGRAIKRDSPSPTTQVDPPRASKATQPLCERVWSPVITQTTPSSQTPAFIAPYTPSITRKSPQEIQAEERLNKMYQFSQYLKANSTAFPYPLSDKPEHWRWIEAFGVKLDDLPEVMSWFNIPFAFNKYERLATEIRDAIANGVLATPLSKTRESWTVVGQLGIGLEELPQFFWTFFGERFEFEDVPSNVSVEKMQVSGELKLQ